MSQKPEHARMIARRGDLLAELFLQQLKPKILLRATPNSGYDFQVGVPNAEGGIDYVFVAVKSTESLGEPRYGLPKRQYARMVHSNIPLKLLVVDVKENRFYSASLNAGAKGVEATTQNSQPVNGNLVPVELTEIKDYAQFLTPDATAIAVVPAQGSG